MRLRSVWQIWGALLRGGRLVVIPTLLSRSPSEFLGLLAREKVTILNQTPSAFYQLIAVQQAPRHAGSRTSCLVAFSEHMNREHGGKFAAVDDQAMRRPRMPRAARRAGWRRSLNPRHLPYVTADNGLARPTHCVVLPRFHTCAGTPKTMISSVELSGVTCLKSWCSQSSRSAELLRLAAYFAA